MKESREFPYEKSKFRTSNLREDRDPKSQTSRSTTRSKDFEACCLDFLWSLELGPWNFSRMRLGTVIGRVTLSKTVPTLIGARWLIVSPFTREHFQRGTQTPPGLSKDPSVVVYDDLGGGVGQTIGFIEGREAASPFDEPTPIDAINAALVDEIFYSPFSK